MKKEERYERILAHFRAQMPNVNTELEFGSVFQLLVAVILSAQCTDKRINQVTPDLFRRYPDAKAMAQAEPEDVLEYINSVSYPNAKAAHLVAMARALVAQHSGEVPSDMNQLLDLPGVGRKTANVVLAEGFGQQQIAVDTHVFRLANRIGITAEKDVLKTELGLQKAIPHDRWTLAHHALIFHGRRCCHARGPECGRCPINDICEKNGVNDVQTL